MPYNNSLFAHFMCKNIGINVACIRYKYLKIFRRNRMSKYKTYEYICLDGYQPEPSMRSKVKATDASTPPDLSLIHI